MTSQPMRKAAPKSADAGSTRRWSGPTSRRTRCGTTMPMNPTGPPTETAAPVASDALTNAATLRRDHVHPARFSAFVAEAQQIQWSGQPRKRRERDNDQGQRRHDRLIAADVEVAHQPAQDAKRLREVREVLHEQDQRREERVHRDAGQAAARWSTGRGAAPGRARRRCQPRPANR